MSGTAAASAVKAKPTSIGTAAMRKGGGAGAQNKEKDDAWADW